MYIFYTPINHLCFVNRAPMSLQMDYAVLLRTAKPKIHRTLVSLASLVMNQFGKFGFKTVD